MSATAAAAAAIAARRRKLVRFMLEQGADRPSRALEMESLPGGHAAPLRQLQRHGIVRVTDEGRLYVDREQLASQRARQRKVIAVLLLIAFAALAVAVAMTVRML